MQIFSLGRDYNILYACVVLRKHTDYCSRYTAPRPVERKSRQHKDYSASVLKFLDYPYACMQPYLCTTTPPRSGHRRFNIYLVAVVRNPFIDMKLN